MMMMMITIQTCQSSMKLKFQDFCITVLKYIKIFFLKERSGLQYCCLKPPQASNFTLDKVDKESNAVE